jgi:PAS domain S-box-containing protein
MENAIDSPAGETTDWFEALLEHSSDLITVVRRDGSVGYQSRSVEHILGYDPGELCGQSFFEFVHPDDRDPLRDRVASMTDTDSSLVTRLEFRFRRADGSWAWLEGIASYRPGTPITGVVFNSRDVTARKESYQQAAVLNRVLRHNLRNGLNVILGHARQLADVGSPETDLGAETIQSTAVDLYETTSYVDDLWDILESSRISQHRQDVTALLEATVGPLAADNPGVTFECDLPNEQCVVAAPKLSVALDHVVRNAVEHNDSDDPRVELSVEEPESDDGYVAVTVADNGPGIPQQEREVLLEGEETPLKHSTGIGLWLLHWIITRSGGRIDFDENEPRGSRVTLSLPPAD